jgi:lipopolysaccharide transport system permease protein
VTATNRTLVIQPTSGWRSINVRELWNYRDLLLIFVWRDIKVRYRQTLLGAVWAMGQPLVTMLIFTLLFSRIARLDAHTTVPYPLFVLGGVLLWNFISAAIHRSGNSLLGASHLISKVYFPRLVIPLSNVVTDAVDLVISALLLVPLMFWYGVMPGPEMLAAPFVVVLAGIFSLGIGLWIAALNVEYRDVRVVVPWILQIAMYVTPVVYPVTAVPERYRWIAMLNPATGLVEGFRATLFGSAVDWRSVSWSVIASLLLLVSGAFYFRRMERLFADEL